MKNDDLQDHDHDHDDDVFNVSNNGDNMLVLITGGSRGLGRAIAKVIAQRYGTSTGMMSRNNSNSAGVSTCSTSEQNNGDVDDNVDVDVEEEDSINNRQQRSSVVKNKLHKIHVKLTIILVARNMNDLQETSKLIFDEVEVAVEVKVNEAVGTTQSKSTTTTTGTTMKQQKTTIGNAVELTTQVICHSMDLANLDLLDANLDIIFKDIPCNNNDNYNSPSCCDYDSIILINNAGSIGYIGNCVDISTPPTNTPTNNTFTLQDMKSNFDFNVTSSNWITTRFLRHVLSSSTTSSATSSRTSSNTSESPVPVPVPNASTSTNVIVVNISSLTAIAKFPTLAIYSAGKACRDKYHEIIATELESQSLESQSHNNNVNNNNVVKIINYAPGPLETQMVTEIRNSKTLHDTLKPSFNQKLLQPEQSATKLIKLIYSLLQLQHDDDDDDHHQRDTNNNKKREKNKDNKNVDVENADYSSIKFQSGDHIDYYDLPP